MMSSAIGAFFQTVGRVFMSTIHTAVTVVIDRTIPHIIAVHHVYHRHNRIRIVGCISIDLYIEDMPSAGQIMVRSFYFCFMPGTASIIDRHMIRVRVIFPVGHSRDDSETLFILLSESPAQSFGRSSQYTIIVLPALRKFIALSRKRVIIRIPNCCAAGSSAWCLPVNATKHSAKPIKPIPSVP